MGDYQHINYSVDNDVATLALNSTDKLNAFHQKMRLELIEAVERIEQEDAIRVVIFTGEGRAFSAGADLTEGMPGYSSFVDQCEAEYKPWLMAIHDSKKIYIAAVNGACAGIGSAVAMNCDLMIMADDAYLYQAFSAIGLMPDGGANWLLLQKLGYQRAFEMAVDAGKLSAQQCFDLGLANKVVAADQLRSAASQWALKLAKGAPLSQAATKKLMRQAASMSYAQVIDQEAVMQSVLINSEDAQNAVAAFFNKQSTVFKGK